MIYLDYAATTPMSDRAVEAYRKAAQSYFGNPSSIHDFGSSAREIVDKARDAIAGTINAKPRGIFFTGSGSEASQLAIQSLLKGHAGAGKHILTTAAEHSSIRYLVNVLKGEGFEVTYIPIDQLGSLDLDALENSIRGDTVLATFHHGNSEIGTLQDLEAIGAILDKHDVLFHTDTVQTFGKVPIDVQAAKVDSLSISAHKIYGPKGTGAVYMNPSAGWKSMIPGTTQEKGFRPGTVDVPSIAAFMTAALEVVDQMEEARSKDIRLRKLLVSRLEDLPYDITFEGSSEKELPNILGLRIHGMEGQYAMVECNRHGLAFSTGSACTVESSKPAATMSALGRSEQEALEFIRISLGKPTTEDEINRGVDILADVLEQHFAMVNR